MTSNDNTTVVLVHGAWHSPWCWNPVVAELDQYGIHSVTVDLPSCRTVDGAPAGDMHADAAEIRNTLDRYEDVVLVAHSYGGFRRPRARPAIRRCGTWSTSPPTTPTRASRSAATRYRTRGRTCSTRRRT
ncbi:hypothetical protein Asera_19580 [Actinocatenispora sera]|uniref:AB hydrolase-1 domain-containing protein n=1 Tax=Actinocatenispora sera TaxID=390989 RepID=A0A810KX90_9ACTN|nr:hypothetical protein Asera_19580 [Actinocatenispora sera]